MGNPRYQTGETVSIYRGIDTKLIASGVDALQIANERSSNTCHECEVLSMMTDYKIGDKRVDLYKVAIKSSGREMWIDEDALTKVIDPNIMFKHKKYRRIT